MFIHKSILEIIIQENALVFSFLVAADVSKIVFSFWPRKTSGGEIPEGVSGSTHFKNKYPFTIDDVDLLSMKEDNGFRGVWFCFWVTLDGPKQVGKKSSKAPTGRTRQDELLRKAG